MTFAVAVATENPERAEVQAHLVSAPIGEHGIDGFDAKTLGRRAFEAKAGESLLLSGPGGHDDLLVGLGDPAKVDLEVLRLVGASVARGARHASVASVELSGLASSLAPRAVARAICEGALLGSYRFSRFKSEPSETTLHELVLVGSDVEELTAGADAARIIADGVVLARDLVNAPAGDLTPRRLAEIASELGEREGLEVQVLDESAIREERLGGLLGVAAGSDEPPRFIRLSYIPEGHPDAPVVALVGKGITFDSGGLSLKPMASMMTMKSDMGGAAAVLAAMGACRRLGVAVRVRAYLPVTENMPGASATKPGDVLRIRNGKTIEVLNTDAEGRLVLADALSLALEDGADAIVDLATLTGACVTALGTGIAGLIGNDDRLIVQVRSATRHAGEAVWPLPLPAGYHSHIDSEIADMKNMGITGQAGALSAALLLQEFIGDVPWAHLDIAGPVRSEEDKGYMTKGATGFGVRTLLELLTSYEPLGGAVIGEAEGIGVLR